MEIIQMGNLTIRLDRANGDVEIDTNGVPWRGKIQDLAAEIVGLLEALKVNADAA
jgi:hypothetical protein